MDIIGNCLVPHQRCQQLQVGGKVVGVPVDERRESCKVIASRRRCVQMHPVSIPRCELLSLFFNLHLFRSRSLKRTYSLFDYRSIVSFFKRRK